MLSKWGKKNGTNRIRFVLQKWNKNIQWKVFERDVIARRALARRGNLKAEHRAKLKV